MRLAKLEGVAIHEVLDCCHATHHIALALIAMGWSDQERLPMYREHRTLLRNGKWRRVVEELTELAEEEPQDSKVWIRASRAVARRDACVDPTLESPFFTQPPRLANDNGLM